ncbi:MAG: glycerophosphodiester phosphodiesterase family protein [Polyangiales bacterium]
MTKSLWIALLLLGLVGTNISAAQAPCEPPYPAWRVELVGHRGLSPGFPENTLAAFRNSIALGVDVIELDLRGTADGEVVILHDETLDRTTDGTGPVTALTLAEIKALDAGSYVDPSFSSERIPTFGEVLELARGTGVKLLLDIKLSEVLNKERIVRLTEQYGATLDVIVGVRSVADLQEFRELNPNLRTLGFIPEVTDSDAFVGAGVDMIRLWPDWIRESRDDAACQSDYAARRAAVARGERQQPGSASCVVQKVHAQGKPVWATADDAPRAQLDELIRLRVNGILTDLPEVLAALRGDIEAQR